LNGNPLELFRADYGLTAALIPAGVHTLTLTYRPPGRSLGIWLSVASIGMLLALRLKTRRRRSNAAAAAGQAAIENAIRAA
jgi:uncharacterized membrane protein YfhO